MTRADEHMPSMLPHLSSGSDRGLATGAENANVFTPSALREHKPPMSMTTNRVFAAALFGLFIIVLLLAFLVGINVYQSLNDMSISEKSMRLEETFLANAVHSNDMQDSIRVGEGPEGKALVLLDRVKDVGVYETRIYTYQGNIVQEYALQSSPYNPEKAITVVRSDKFIFSYDEGLLSIETDDGIVDIALRSVEGA